jgi:ribosomal protein S18 acetylase RimI-like enzyme
LCVDEEHRGNGIGTILLDYVTEFARKNKFYNITLNVWALNDNAKCFYERNGMNIQKYGMEKIVKQEVE